MLASFLKRDLRNLFRKDASPNFQAQNGLLSLRSRWRSVRSLIFTDKIICSSPLAAAQPLNILPRPETLNASGSRRACRMAVRRNACSLLTLPDSPEFAPAVRYGVPGSPAPR